MIIKTQIVDSITVDEGNVVHVRTATVVAEDGAELSRSYHRHTLAPGESLVGQDARVIAIANAVWTPA